MRLIACLILAVSLATVAPAPATAQLDRDYGEIANQAADQLRGLTSEHLLAIGVGALIGASIVETFLDGGLFTFVGMVMGGVVGDWWYGEQLWPFARRR